MSGPDPQVGLCASCQRSRIVQTDRSTFYLCTRSFTDPAFVRYPPLPVTRCPGYDPPVDVPPEETPPRVR